MINEFLIASTIVSAITTIWYLCQQNTRDRISSTYDEKYWSGPTILAFLAATLLAIKIVLACFIFGTFLTFLGFALVKLVLFVIG